MDRRDFNRRLATLLGAGMLPTVNAHAAQVALPSMIDLIVPFAPGGGTDQLARALAQVVTPDFAGSNIVVENKPGANGAIAARFVSNQKADGGTVLLGSSSTQALGPLILKFEIDPIKDLTPVSLLAEIANVLVVPAESKIKTLADYIAYAKNHIVTFGSFGVGSSGHLYGLLFAATEKIQLTHVPYKGSSQAITDMLGGNVDSVFLTTSAVYGLAKAGKVRVLAVTGPHRTGLFPEVQTFKELGVRSLDFNGWFGLFAPKGTPPEIARSIADRTNSATKDKDFVQRMKSEGYDWVGGGPQALDRELRSSIDIYKKILAKNPIKI